MSNSTRYQLAQALYAVATSVATANSADALLNPKLPLDTKGRASRILFVLDRGDRLVDQQGQREKRRARLVLGALASTTTADADADALHFAARAACKSATVRASLAALNAPVMREVEVEPELREVAVDGALLLSAFEIEYLETYPAA